MSWFNTSGFASLAKSALNQAQKTIDKALDIQDTNILTPSESANPISSQPSNPDATDSFFASFGLDEGAPPSPKPKNLQAPKPASAQTGLKAEKQASSIWGSFTGSFFEPGNSQASSPEHRPKETLSATIASQPGKSVHYPERYRTMSLGESVEDGERNLRPKPKSSKVHRSSESVPEVFVTRQTKPAPSSATDSINTISTPAMLDNEVNLGEEKHSLHAKVKQRDPEEDPEVKIEDNIESTNTPLRGECETSIQNEPISEKVDVKEETEQPALDLTKSGASFSSASSENMIANPCNRLEQSKNEWSSSAWEIQSVDSTVGVDENRSQTDCKDPQERLSECCVPTAEDFKTSSLSFMSASSSSTTGESSSTLDESVGTISALSEKEALSSRHSSTTLTPEVFSDSGESALPMGMSSSWDLGDGNAEPTASSYSVINDDQNKAGEPERPIASDFDGRADLDDTLTDEHNVNVETGTLELKPDDDTKSLDYLDISMPVSQDNIEKIIFSEKDTGSPSNSSLLSYMIEDAMVESVGTIGRPMISTTRAYSPNSTASSTSSNAERSDPVKTTESEQNSGHTSGDEIETTTSSDIEIISSPSIAGESGCERGGSISPVKPSSMWRNKHGSGACSSSRYHMPSSIRSDSPASDTSSTKDGHPVQFGAAPVRPDLCFTSVVPPKSKHQRKVSEASSEDSDQARIEALMRKVSEMTNILEAREAKVLDLSHENMDLIEKNNTLKSQLKKAEEVRAADTRDVSSFTKELTERLSNTEKKMQLALREKEALKRDLQQATIEIASRVSAAQVEEIKKEKDTQITELMQEGESLSKKVLQYSNNVKKLRAKEKENENHIKQQREKIEEQSRELDRIRKALGAKEEVEKNQIELIRQLTNTVQKNEKEITTIKSDLEDAQEKQKSMKTAMESAYRELSELHRKNAEQDSKSQEAALSAEMLAKEELRMTLEKLQHESRLQQDGLVFQIEDLQLTMSRSEQQAGQREDALRQDIANLQQRLQEAEGRNDELNQNVSAATQPLLRQIDNLQATLNIQTSSWERVERNLSDRLTEAQNQLAHAIEKERAIAEKYADLGAKVASLEAKNSLVRQEKARLQALLDASTGELQLLKESKEKESVLVETFKRNFKDNIASLQREKDMFEHQLEIEKTALEAEKRKTSLLQDQLKENEQRLSKQAYNLEGSRGSSPGSRSNMSMRGSFSDNFQSSWYQEDAQESGVVFPTAPIARMNVYETLRAGSMSTLLDSLQSQLKLRDGDIAQLQNDISQLERVKESMTEELVKLNAKIEELEIEIASLKEQETNFQDMGQKYNALLQMYGEKIEEAEELRLDLQDVKDMYKAQIDDLLRRK